MYSGVIHHIVLLIIFPLGWVSTEFLALRQNAQSNAVRNNNERACDVHGIDDISFKHSRALPKLHGHSWFVLIIKGKNQN